MGYESFSAEIPDAEEAKHYQVAAFCWQVSVRTTSPAPMRLSPWVAAFTDVAGFVAATWLRGVALFTSDHPCSAWWTLLKAVKTGINTAEGKNLVGAFWPPAAVLCEIGTLAPCPRTSC